MEKAFDMLFDQVEEDPRGDKGKIKEMILGLMKTLRIQELVPSNVWDTTTTVLSGMKSGLSKIDDANTSVTEKIGGIVDVSISSCQAMIMHQLGFVENFLSPRQALTREEKALLLVEEYEANSEIGRKVRELKKYLSLLSYSTDLTPSRQEAVRVMEMVFHLLE